MITTSYIYDRKKVAKGSVPGVIEIRITDRRKSWYISTGVKVLKSEWSAGSVVNRNDAHMLNRRLAAMVNVVGDAIDACILEQKPIDIEAIKCKLNADVKNGGEKVVEWIKKEVPLLKLKPGTRRRYATLLNRLYEYDGLTHWGDITVEGICRFDEWLHTIKKPQSRAERLAGVAEEYISDAGVYNYHKCLKAMLSRAERFGKIAQNPYSRLQGEFSKGDVPNIEFLTEDEMRAVENMHPVANSDMAVARDLFVWQMHTGMSYSDTQSMDFSKYKKVDGRWTYIGPRVKTGVDYILQLDSTCEDILRYYGWKLPKLSNQRYNICLKALGIAAGISTPLHSHLARHSFATYMLANNVPIQNVSKMLGHTNTIQTQRYAKVLPQSVFDDFSRIEAKKKNKQN